MSQGRTSHMTAVNDTPTTNKNEKKMNDDDIVPAPASQKPSSSCATTLSTTTSTASTTFEQVNDKAKGLFVEVHRGYQAKDKARYWWDTICRHTQWYRVHYKSGRFDKECETPCWTTFFGGRSEYTPFQPIPHWLQPLVDQVSQDLGCCTRRPFNAILVRLYFDGNDEIAWHTDGRTFLGSTPTIASLSLGANASFQMRRMTNVWPSLLRSSSTNKNSNMKNGDDRSGIDRNTPQRHFCVGNGDLLVMRGATQQHWHHRVPKERGRRPRLNINFRYIQSSSDAERGQKTYYKYMVHGDHDAAVAGTAANSYSYKQIQKMRNGVIRNYFGVPKPKCMALGAAATVAVADPAIPDQKKSCPKVAAAATTATATSTTATYLAAEKIDTATFLSLPPEIRKELVDEWTLSRPKKKPTPPLFGRINKNGPLGKKRTKQQGSSTSSYQYKPKKTTGSKKRNIGNNGNSTLDQFFSSAIQK